MGWQRQTHGPSVQQTIEDAARTIAQEETVVHAAGRTDAGVHALGMRAPVDVERALTPLRLMDALNSVMRPVPVLNLGCRLVPYNWHEPFPTAEERHCRKGGR